MSLKRMALALTAALSLLPGVSAQKQVTNMSLPRTLELYMVYPRGGAVYQPAKVFPLVFAMRNADLADGLGMVLTMSMKNDTPADYDYGESGWPTLPIDQRTFTKFGDGSNNGTASEDPFFFYTYVHNVTTRGDEKTTDFEVMWDLSYTLCPSEDSTGQDTNVLYDNIKFQISKDEDADAVPPAEGLVVPAGDDGCAEGDVDTRRRNLNVAFNVTGGFDVDWRSATRHDKGTVHHNCYRTSVPDTKESRGRAWVNGTCPATVDKDEAATILDKLCDRAGGGDDCYAEPESAAPPPFARVAPAVAACAAAALAALVVQI